MKTIESDAKEKMIKALASLEREFNKIRTGRATTALVDNIRIDYYGTISPINQMASVTTPDSRTIAIQPWDKGTFPLIEKAIMQANLGLNPVNDGMLIRIPIPPLTEERRKEFVRIAKKSAEDAKIVVRNIRRDANDSFKKLEKEKTISEDDCKRVQDEMQKLTDDNIAKIDSLTQVKEKEIMEV